MVRELQSKFIKTTMLVVTLLLVLFLAAMNLLNLYLSRSESRSRIGRISEESLAAFAPDAKAGRAPGGNEQLRQEPGHYFCARVSDDGTILRIDLDHAGGLTEEQAAALIDQVKTKKTGRTGSYMYSVQQRGDGTLLYTFLDISSETGGIVRVLLVTCVLGAVLWVLVFLLVLALSRRAIRPIAENVEKQRQFITNAGHELKTPLAVITANVDAQELHTGKSRWLENIRSQALRLSDLTRQMLTLAKTDESGGAAFTSTTFDASADLRDTAEVFRESAALKRMELVLHVEDGIRIHFDREQFRQMLELLFDNAVKYGKEGGALDVSFRRERRKALLKISNDCDALPDCDPDRLFERFYRADVSRSRSTGGSGIGLAVVRAVAESAGGRAGCRYEGADRITFEVELPQA